MQLKSLSGLTKRMDPMIVESLKGTKASLSSKSLKEYRKISLEECGNLRWKSQTPQVIRSFQNWSGLSLSMALRFAMWRSVSPRKSGLILNHLANLFKLDQGLSLPRLFYYIFYPFPHPSAF